MATIHLFPNGQVEVVQRRFNAVGTYRFTPGYSAATKSGAETQPLTRRHWQQIATRDGDRLKFHDSKESAVAAQK